MARIRWIKSNYSEPDGDNYLEPMPDGTAHSGTVPARDSKQHDGPVLRLPTIQWAHFVDHMGV
ncbi:DUF397 domain-containing protein [Streptomyces sp. NPDC002490]|uniref:DUF397 domain-containing protein n=1 Tax=Streptomyces sp. NPDC002490 TaxID=3154416 RepID=UPI0033245C2D